MRLGTSKLKPGEGRQLISRSRSETPGSKINLFVFRVLQMFTEWNPGVVELSSPQLWYPTVAHI